MTGTSPTARQRELGTRMRGLRNEHNMTVEEVAERLHRAGYLRGTFMCLTLARRWIGITAALLPDRGSMLLELDAGDPAAFHQYLLSLPGVGGLST